MFSLQWKRTDIVKSDELKQKSQQDRLSFLLPTECKIFVFCIA